MLFHMVKCHTEAAASKVDLLCRATREERSVSARVPRKSNWFRDVPQGTPAFAPARNFAEYPWICHGC